MKFRNIKIELSSICNFQCLYCPTKDITRPKTFMETELARSLINQILELNITDNLCFYVMGEPLLHKDIVSIIQYAKDLGFNVALNTNGSLLTHPLNLEILKVVNMLAISLHIDFVKGKYFENEWYQNIFNTILEKYKNNLPCEIRLVVFTPHRYFMKDNRLLDLLPGIKIQIVKIHNWGQNKFKALFGSCDGLRDRMAILADGSFSLCCADWNGKVVIGNAHIQTLKEVLQSKLAWKVISDFKHNRFHFDYCKKCRGGYDIKSWLYNQIHSTIFYNNKKEIER